MHCQFHFVFLDFAGEVKRRILSGLGIETEVVFIIGTVKKGVEIPFAITRSIRA
jgi:hypothetical protein